MLVRSKGKSWAHIGRELAECNFVSAEILASGIRESHLIGPYATRPPDGDRGTYKTRPTIIVCPATYSCPSVVRGCRRESRSLYNKDDERRGVRRTTANDDGETISRRRQFEKYCATALQEILPRKLMNLGGTMFI